MKGLLWVLAGVGVLCAGFVVWFVKSPALQAKVNTAVAKAEAKLKA